MSKFTIVKNPPKNLNKGEIIITGPNFLEQVEQNLRKEPRQKVTSLNHVREILNSIAQKYDKDMDVMRIKLVNYEGLPYQNNEELHNIIIRILESEYPAVLSKYVDYHLKRRPMGTKLVYYTSDLTSTTPFYDNGLDLLDEKDIESYLQNKPKKTVGKPAVTDTDTQKNDSL